MRITKPQLKEFLTVFMGRVGLLVTAILFLKLTISYLDPADFGRYTFLFATASWLSTLVFNPGNVPFSRAAAQPEFVETVQNLLVPLAAKAFWFGIVLTFVPAGVILVLWDNGYSLLQGLLIAFAIAFLAAGIGITGLVSSYCIGRRFRLSNVLLLNGQMSVRILCVVVLIFVFPLSSETLFYLISFGSVSFLAIILFYFQCQYRSQRLSLKSIRRLLIQIGFVKQYAANWVVVNLSNFLTYGDKVVLAFVLPIEMVGLLALYQQLSRAMAQVSIGTVIQFITPFVLKKEQSNSARLYLAIGLFVFFCFSIVSLVVGFFLPAINTYFLKSSFELVLSNFVIIALFIAFSQVSRINELRFFAADKVGKIIMPLALSVLTFLVVGILLALKFGIVGAAIGLLLSAMVRYFSVLWVSATGSI
jgi:O-antigen/teichoic acid export membrane protein